MKILGVIPARGGSKGVPRKNIKDLAGKPLIAYTIQAAKQCQAIDKLILSTDDEEIAQVGRELGIEVPFLRPAELATDQADAMSFIKHALNFVMEQGYQPDLLVVLQPTSPLRDAEDIFGGIKLLTESNFDQVISVTKVSQHPYWMKVLGPNQEVQPFIDDMVHPPRRQDLPDVYIPNGALYIYKTEYLLSERVTPKVGAYIMDEWKSLDIDTPLDFYITEKVIQGIQQGNLRFIDNSRTK